MSATGFVWHERYAWQAAFYGELQPHQAAAVDAAAQVARVPA